MLRYVAAAEAEDGAADPGRKAGSSGDRTTASFVAGRAQPTGALGPRAQRVQLPASDFIQTPVAVSVL